MSLAAPPDPTQEITLPRPKTTKDGDLEFLKDLPLEIVHMIITNLAMLGSQHAVTAMLVCKQLVSKLSTYVYNGSQVHWINLTDFMAALKKDNVQELESLTIDLRQEIEVHMLGVGFGISISNARHRKHLPNPEKDRKRSDANGSTNALSECNFKVKHLRVIDFYKQMDYNKGLNKDFASSIQSLTCLEYGQRKAQGKREEKDWHTLMFHHYSKVECEDRKVVDLPNCQFLWMEPSKKDFYVRCGKPMFNLSNLEYVYIIYNDKASYDDLESVKRLGALNIIGDNTKVALVIQYHAEPPSSSMMRRAERVAYRVERELQWNDPKLTKWTSKANREKRFLHRLACTIMHCPKKETLNTEQGRSRIQNALEPIWKAKEKIRKDNPNEQLYDYRSCYSIPLRKLGALERKDNPSP